MERVVLASAKVTLGRVLRYQGYFERSLVLLRELHGEIHDRPVFDDVRWDVAYNLADVLTELNLPVEARRVLEAEREVLIDKRGVHSTQYKQLQLAFAETLMREKLLDEAEEIYRMICGGGNYAQIRRSAGLARIAQLHSNWEEA